MTDPDTPATGVVTISTFVGGPASVTETACDGTLVYSSFLAVTVNE